MYVDSSNEYVLDTHHVILGYTNGNEVFRSFVNFCLLVIKWEL